MAVPEGTETVRVEIPPVVTLAGYRHKDMASYWNDPTSAELVGDWSSIPANRRGFAQRLLLPHP